MEEAAAAGAGGMSRSGAGPWPRHTALLHGAQRPSTIQSTGRAGASKEAPCPGMGSLHPGMGSLLMVGTWPRRQQGWQEIACRGSEGAHGWEKKPSTATLGMGN